MKLTSFTARLASVAALLATWPTLAEAHPGHSAFDWYSYAPHTGHESEYSVVLNVLAILILATAIYCLAPRKE